MGDRAPNVSKGWMRAATFLAVSLVLMFLLAPGVRAQESDTDQTDNATEETTSETTDQTPAEPEETPAAPKVQKQPAAEGDEPTTPTEEDQDPVAQTQDSSEEPEQESQGSGQQARAQNDAMEDSEGALTATRAVTTPREQPAQIIEDGGTRRVDRIIVTVDVGDCRVSSDASMLIEDDSGTRVRVANEENATITSDDNEVEVTVNGSLRPLEQGDDGPFGTESVTETGRAVNSSGITCGRDNNPNDDGEAGDEGRDNGDGRDRNDDLEDLNCDELLRRFREEGEQYGNDLDQFADVDIRNQIIICLEQEVDDDTAADEKLPNTGGPSLIGFAALGLASVVAGAALVRGRRED